MIRLIIVDDHVVVRQGFRQLLSQQPDFEVVGEAGDGDTTLRLVEELRPDVLVLDLVMPGLSGLEILDQLHRASSPTKVVVLSMQDDRNYVLRALRSGALAYLLKESSSDDLVQAIRFVQHGHHYLSAPLVEHVIAAYLQTLDPQPVAPDKSLSLREREVLQRLSAGQTNNEIAQAIGVSTTTIVTYCRRIRGKLDLHSQAELRHYALQQNRHG